ncbi:50S ribosomal protein L10 [Buchnera aphidicola]|uniref:Large ribosomal subunit protein uL10 n=1 Tax=Buchnera aphidicola (Anoecia oenotherae) TaxID=1241833 RepID=A0A4D6Y406_9GAMM|nr:50S ribosomal protein L10 [Buchnera aphidicola]QCI19175.1 50S ribosomal protein L10 [Buchnera aphidicola (Anoecia oenotherae)]
MAINKKKKKTIISRITKVNSLAVSAVISDITGVSVNNITKLRKAAKEVGVVVYSVRNSLLKRSVNGTMFQCLKDQLSGPTLIAYSLEHPGSAARLLDDFQNKKINLKIKGAVFKNRMLLPDEIKSLIAMPTYNEAIGKIMLILQEISIGKLFKTVMAIYNKKKDSIKK